MQMVCKKITVSEIVLFVEFFRPVWYTEIEISTETGGIIVWT